MFCVRLTKLKQKWSWSDVWWREHHDLHYLPSMRGIFTKIVNKIISDIFRTHVKDNNNRHAGKSTTKWIQENKVHLLERPNQTPDLQLLWNDLKRAVYTRHFTISELNAPSKPPIVVSDLIQVWFDQVQRYQMYLFEVWAALTPMDHLFLPPALQVFGCVKDTWVLMFVFYCDSCGRNQTLFCLAAKNLFNFPCYCIWSATQF